MKKSITPNQIKQNNHNIIYHFIYANQNVSQQDISYHLRLSRPTVAANLAAMEADGLIQKSGSIDTEFVGRKAAAYTIVPDCRIGIGVELLRNEVKMTAIDLYGQEINAASCEITFVRSEIYYRMVCSKILEFKNSLALADEQILGIGFAIQGLITPDKQSVLYGEPLACTGLSTREFSRHLPYPCSFIQTADSEALSELWASPELTDAFYLSLSRHLGAAVISKGVILTGKHGHNSTIEHIQMNPGGSRCYCGKIGCLETLLSLSALLEGRESIDTFFLKVRQNDPSCQNRWSAFLSDLAHAVGMLHLVCDTDFILGGDLAQYLRAEDLDFLYEKIEQMMPFSEPRDFLQISKLVCHNISIGAALPYIQAFLNTSDI